jgi:hypothetical protein
MLDGGTDVPPFADETPRDLLLLPHQGNGAAPRLHASANAMRFSQFASEIDQLDTRLGWVPWWLVSALLIVVAIVVALIAHSIAVLLARRATRNKTGLVARTLALTYRPARFAFACIAVALVLPLAPLSDTAQFWLTHALLIAFIALASWVASTALTIVSGEYLRRFRLDSEDNLLAGKHVTQVQLLRRTIETLNIIFATAAALMTFGSVRQYGCGTTTWSICRSLRQENGRSRCVRS